MNRLCLFVCLLLMMSLAFGCTQQQPSQQQPTTPPDTRAADEAAIKAAEANWTKSTTADQFASFYSDDAVVLPPNAPALATKDAIKKMWTDMMSAPGFALTFQSTKVYVARSGDLGYTQGTYEMTMNDAKGKPMTDKGKYLTVWKKQGADWKAVEDMFSSDSPAPVAAVKK